MNTDPVRNIADPFRLAGCATPTVKGPPPPPDLGEVRLDGPYQRGVAEIMPTAAFLITVSAMLGYVLGVLSVIWWPR